MTCNFPPLPRNPATDALAAKAQAIYQEFGRTLGAEGTGGGADGSFTAAIETPTLDAFGFANGGPHTANEYLDLDTIGQARSSRRR